jgi:DNA-directed RNA polymerase subunit N (RpoN/RPB10)
MSDREEESRKYYLKNRERILAYQHKRRIEKKAELKAERDNKKLKKQTYDFNRRRNQNLTIDEWQKILTEFDNRCVRCGAVLGSYYKPVPWVARYSNHTLIIPLCFDCTKQFSSRWTSDEWFLEEMSELVKRKMNI